MARKQPAKKARKKSAAKPAARKSAKKAVKAAPKKAVKTAAKKKGAKTAAKPSAKKAVKRGKPKGADKRAAKAVRRPPAKAAKVASRAAAKVAPRAAAKQATPPRRSMTATPAPPAGKKPNLDRPRKTVADVHGIPSSLDMNRTPSAAKSGRAEMRDKLSKNNSGGAAITAGDVDADWQSAESVGDEAPGGDNPTPDQDVVDDIGRALGVEYADDEELQGGAEIADRDHNRWELDPASKDDFEDEE